MRRRGRSAGGYALALAFLLPSLVLGLVATKAEAANAVTISNFSYSPTPLSATLGKIKVSNQDPALHSLTLCNPTHCQGVTACSGGPCQSHFDTRQFAGPADRTILIDSPGRYIYYCSVHGYPLMTGEIDAGITAGPTANPAPAPTRSAAPPPPVPRSSSPTPRATPSPSPTPSSSPAPSPSPSDDVVALAVPTDAGLPSSAPVPAAAPIRASAAGPMGGPLPIVLLVLGIAMLAGGGAYWYRNRQAS